MHLQEPENKIINTDQEWLESEIGMNFLQWMTGDAELIRNEERAIELNSVNGFRVEYCRELYKHLAAGKTYESFGAKLGILPSTKKRFEDRVPEWRFAKEIGLMAGMEEMESKGLSLIEGKQGGTVWMEWMKSKYGWGGVKKTEVKVEADIQVGHKIQSVRSTVPIAIDDQSVTDVEVASE